MKQTILSQIDVYTDLIKGIDIDREQIKQGIIKSFIAQNRISNNPKDYSYEDYILPFSLPLQWTEDYIRDHFTLESGGKNLVIQGVWGNLYNTGEQSYTRHQVDPLNLRESSDYTTIYCIDITEGSTELVIEYDDNRRVNRTWHFPLQNNQFVIFPSSQRYFISKNKSSSLNLFISFNWTWV